MSTLGAGAELWFGYCADCRKNDKKSWELKYFLVLICFLFLYKDVFFCYTAIRKLGDGAEWFS